MACACIPSASPAVLLQAQGPVLGHMLVAGYVTETACVPMACMHGGSPVARCDVITVCGTAKMFESEGILILTAYHLQHGH